MNVIFDFPSNDVGYPIDYPSNDFEDPIEGPYQSIGCLPGYHFSYDKQDCIPDNPVVGSKSTIPRYAGYNYQFAMKMLRSYR